MNYDLLLNKPKTNLVALLILVYIIGYLSMGYPLQNALNSNYLQERSYKTTTLYYMPFLTEIGHIMMPLYLLLTITVALLSYLSNKLKRKNFSLTMTYVIFIFRLIVLLISEIILYLTSFKQISPQHISRDIFQVNTNRQFMINIILDISVIIQSFQFTIFFTLFNCLLTSSLVFFMHLFDDQIYGNFYIDLTLTAISMYYFIASILCAIFVLNRLTSENFVVIFITVQVISIFTLIAVKYIRRYYKIMKTCKNLLYIDNIVYSIKKNLQEHNQIQTQLNNQLSIKENKSRLFSPTMNNLFQTFDNDSQNNEYFQQQEFDQKVVKRRILQKLVQVTNNQLSHVYYELMSQHLMENNCDIECINQFQLVKINQNQQIVQENNYYNKEQILQFQKSFNEYPNVLIETAQYLERVCCNKNVDDLIHIVKQLKIQGSLEFKTTSLNETEKQEVSNLLTYQIQQKIISLLEYATFINPMRYNYVYVVYMLRLFLTNPQLNVINVQIQKTSNKQNKQQQEQNDDISQHINQQNLKFKKVHENIELVYFNYKEELLQNTEILSKEQCNTLLDQLMFCNEVYEGIAKLKTHNNTQSVEDESLLKSQNSQLEILNQFKRRYDYIEQLLNPLQTTQQINNYKVLQQILQLISKNIGNIINQVVFYKDQLEVFASIHTYNYLYENINNAIISIKYIISTYDQSQLDQVNEGQMDQIEELLKLTQYKLSIQAQQIEKQLFTDQYQTLCQKNNYYSVMQKFLQYIDQFEQVVFKDLELMTKSFNELQQLKKLQNNELQQDFIHKVHLMIQRATNVVPFLIQLQEIFIRCNKDTNKYDAQFIEHFNNAGLFQGYSITVVNQIKSLKDQIKEIEKCQYQQYEDQRIQTYKLLMQLSHELFKYQYNLYEQFQIQQKKTVISKIQIFNNNQQQKLTPIKQLRKIKKLFEQLLITMFKQFNDDQKEENKQNIKDLFNYFYHQPNQEQTYYVNQLYFQFQEINQLISIYNVVYCNSKKQFIYQILLKNNDLLNQSYFKQIMVNTNILIDQNTNSLDSQENVANNYLSQISHQNIDSQGEISNFGSNQSNDSINQSQAVNDNVEIQQQQNNIECLRYIQNNQNNDVVATEITIINKYPKIDFLQQDTYRKKIKQQNIDQQYKQCKQKEQKYLLFSRNRLKNLFTGPTALYEHNDIDNFKHYKHLNTRQNSIIQNMLRHQQRINKNILIFTSLFLSISLFCGTLFFLSVSRSYKIKKVALSVSSEYITLIPILKQYQLVYLQKQSKNNTLPFSLANFSDVTTGKFYHNLLQDYEKNYKQLENKLLQIQMDLSSAMSSLQEYAVQITSQVINTFSRFLSIFKYNQESQNTYNNSNVSYNNSLVQIENKWYASQRAAQYSEKIFQINSKNSQIQPYLNSIQKYQNNYVLSSLLKNVIMVIRTIFVQTKQGLEQSTLLIAGDKQDLFNQQLSDLKINYETIQLVDTSSPNLYYVGKLTENQYVQYQNDHCLDYNRLIFYLKNYFQYNKSNVNTIDDHIIYTYTQNSYSIIYLVILILTFLLFIPIFLKNCHLVKKNFVNIVKEIENDIKYNYADYFPTDLLNNKIYRDTKIQRFYVNYINNLNNNKITIIPPKQSIIKNLMQNKNKSYFSPVLSKFCKSKYHDQSKLEQTSHFSKLLNLCFYIFFAILYLRNIYFQNLFGLNYIKSTDIKYVNEYNKDMAAINGLTFKFQLFGRQQDFEYITMGLSNIKSQFSNVYHILPIQQQSEFLANHNQFLQKAYHNIIYTYEINCNTEFYNDFPKPRDFVFMKENQHSIPQLEKDKNIQGSCVNIQNQLKITIQNYSSIIETVQKEIKTQQISRLEKYDPTPTPIIKFNVYYASLADFQKIQYYQLISSALTEMNNYYNKIQGRLYQYLIDQQNVCIKNKNEEYQLNNQLVIMIFVTFMLLSLQYYIKILKQSKIVYFVLFLVFNFIIALLLHLISRFMLRNKCENIQINGDLGYNIYNMDALITNIKQNNFLNQLENIMKEYKKVQTKFASFGYNSNYTMDDVMNSNNTNVLTQIGLTNKDFYDMSSFTKATSERLLYGDFSTDKLYMEYITVLGNNLKNSQVGIVTNDIQKQQTGFMYIGCSTLVILIHFVGSILIIFYISKSKQITASNNSPTNHDVDVIVKPYLVLFLKKQVTKSGKNIFNYLYDEKFSVNKMYEQYDNNKLLTKRKKCTKRENQTQKIDFLKLKQDFEQTLTEIENGDNTFNRLLMNPPDFVAFCIQEKDLTYQIQPATFNCNLYRNCCIKCAEKDIRIQQQFDKNYDNSKNEEIIHQNIKLQQYYILVFVLVLLYFICGFGMCTYFLSKSSKLITKLDKHAEIIYSLIDVNIQYENYKMACYNKQNYGYFSQIALESIQKHQDLLSLNEYVDNKFIRQQNVIFSLFKTSLFTCENLMDTTEISNRAYVEIQNVLKGVRDSYCWYYNIWTFSLLILVIFLALQASLNVIDSEMRWLDTIYGFLTQGRVGLQKFIVR